MQHYSLATLPQRHVVAAGTETSSELLRHGVAFALSRIGGTRFGSFYDLVGGPHAGRLYFSDKREEAIKITCSGRPADVASQLPRWWKSARFPSRDRPDLEKGCEISFLWLEGQETEELPAMLVLPVWR